MRLGEFELHSISDGDFWLDGGSMYGVVPKVLWNKLTPADGENRIKLSLNCLLIKTPEKMVLVDTGLGDKFSKRLKAIYKTERSRNVHTSLAALRIEPSDIDFVINTHLHFDHCGGNTIKENGKYVPAFPNAKYIIQKDEWSNANQPNEKTTSSYRPDDFLPLEEAGQLQLIEGDYDVIPGIKTIVTRGHTLGHQSVLITSEGNHAFYLGDLIPMTYHLKIPYVTGFDLYPVELLDTKKGILNRAVLEKWLLIFEHDPDIVFAHITKDAGVVKLVPVEDGNTKTQNPKNKQISKNQYSKSKPPDLEKRTIQFAEDVIEFVKMIPKTVGNVENSRQLVKSSGSVGANYVEANEALSRKDFVMRIKICRKESKESGYWLKLIESGSQQAESKRQSLIDEATQLLKIFSSIVEKSK
jgi:four helix bundle protein